MGHCKVEIDAGSKPGELIRKCKEKVEANGGEFIGNEQHGIISIQTPLGRLEAKYELVNRHVVIDIHRKPVIISCERIKSIVKDLLSINKILF